MIKQIPITDNLFLELSTSSREDSYEDVDESGEVITRPCIVNNDVWTFVDDSGGPGFEQAILEIYEDTWVDDYYGADSDGKYIASSYSYTDTSLRKHIRTFLNWELRVWDMGKYPWVNRWQIEDLKSLLRRSFNLEELQSTLNYPRGDIL